MIRKISRDVPESRYSVCAPPPQPQPTGTANAEVVEACSRDSRGFEKVAAIDNDRRTHQGAHAIEIGRRYGCHSVRISSASAPSIAS